MKNNLYNKHESGIIYNFGYKQCKAMIFKPEKIEEKYILCQHCNKYTCLLCNTSIECSQDICCIKKIFSNIINIGIKYFNFDVKYCKRKEYHREYCNKVPNN